MTTAVSSVLALYQPEAQAEQIAVLMRLVSRRGYSKAELAYAVEELAFDETMNEKLRYKAPVTPADFERVIKASREHRAALSTPQRDTKVRELLSKYPELEREKFKQCKFDEFNNPLFLYVEK